MTNSSTLLPINTRRAQLDGNIFLVGNDIANIETGSILFKGIQKKALFHTRTKSVLHTDRKRISFYSLTSKTEKHYLEGSKIETFRWLGDEILFVNTSGVNSKNHFFKISEQGLTLIKSDPYERSFFGTIVDTEFYSDLNPTFFVSNYDKNYKHTKIYLVNGVEIIEYVPVNKEDINFVTATSKYLLLAGGKAGNEELVYFDPKTKTSCSMKIPNKTIMNFVNGKFLTSYNSKTSQYTLSEIDTNCNRKSYLVSSDYLGMQLMGTTLYVQENLNSYIIHNGNFITLKFGQGEGLFARSQDDYLSFALNPNSKRLTVKKHNLLNQTTTQIDEKYINLNCNSTTQTYSACKNKGVYNEELFIDTVNESTFNTYRRFLDKQGNFLAAQFESSESSEGETFSGGGGKDYQQNLNRIRTGFMITPYDDQDIWINTP